MNVVGQSLARKLARGEIDADAQSVIVCVIAVPGLDLPAGFGKSPVADGENHAAFFCLRDECKGRDDAAFGVDPADESLNADDAPGA